MSDFLTNGAAVLPDVKADVRVPTGSVGEWTAEDCNDLRQAALDLRSEVINIVQAGTGAGSTTPVTANGSLTARTLGERFADTVDPMDFGAVGDGATDDTVAVQACVTHCLGFTPPKAMVVTHRHRLASSVNIDRQINTIADITRFRVIGYGDGAGFNATTDINLFSSSIAPISTQAQSGMVTFENVAFTADVIGRTVYVLAERFIRVAFVGCTFNLVGCYAYSTCFAQDMIWDRCTISAGSTVFAASQGSYACGFSNCNAWGDARPGLFYSGGAGHGTQGFRFIGNLVETLGGYVASLAGCYGCSVIGNHFESMQTANSFNLFGAAANSNISFIGNFVVLYAGPFVYCGPTSSIHSAGNYLTITGDTLVGDRYLYGNADQVTDLVSIGDHCTGGMGAAISDATYPSVVAGVTRSGATYAEWSGLFGFGVAPNADARAVFLGLGLTAATYSATFTDSNGNLTAGFKDNRVTQLALASHADNAAALAAGLVAGDLYHTAGAVKVVT